MLCGQGRQNPGWHPSLLLGQVRKYKRRILRVGINWYKTHFTVSACDISSGEVEQVVVTIGMDGSVEWRSRFESSL